MGSPRRSGTPPPPTTRGAFLFATSIRSDALRPVVAQVQSDRLSCFFLESGHFSHRWVVACRRFDLEAAVPQRFQPGDGIDSRRRGAEGNEPVVQQQRSNRSDQLPCHLSSVGIAAVGHRESGSRIGFQNQGFQVLIVLPETTDSLHTPKPIAVPGRTAYDQAIDRRFV